jgi:hypothetical protein
MEQDLCSSPNFPSVMFYKRCMTLIVISITLISFVLVVVVAGEIFLIHAQNQTNMQQN